MDNSESMCKDCKYESLRTNNISIMTSKRITSLRFLLIVFVIFIHNCYTNELIQNIIEQGGEPPVFVENEVGHWIKLFITYGIARSAVPLFFMFASFLQTKKNYDYATLLKKRTKSLLLPFIIWNLINIFYFGGLKLIVAKIAPHYIGHPEYNMFTWTLSDWISKILGYKHGGNWAVEMPTIVYQFWFIRDLIILVIISPLLSLLIKKFPNAVLFLIAALYFIQVRKNFVETQALFFYIIGIYWAIYDFQLFETVDRITWLEAIVLFSFSFFYTYTVGRGDHTTEHYIMVVFGCFILLKLSLFIVQNEKLYSICAALSGYSFFLFCIHAPILNIIISKYWIRFFPMKNTFFSMLQYFIPSFLVIIIGTGVGILLKKICPPLFRLLNGGR